MPLDRVETLRRGGGGEARVRLRDGTELPVSRNRREELERRLVGRAAVAKGRA